MPIAPQYLRSFDYTGVIACTSAYACEGAGSFGGGSGVWPCGANYAAYIPFVVPRRIVVTKGFWTNRSAVSGNIDIGIYSDAKSKIVSSGSTAQAGTNTTQIVTLSATLDPGYYWMAMAMDNVTGQVYNVALSYALLSVFGVQTEASAFPLPSTATMSNPTWTTMPWFGLGIRKYI